MFSKSAHVYDRIYSKLKDYADEARQIREIIQNEYPDASSILDVGCGTGEHAKILSEEFGYHVDGIDLNKEFIESARQKIPTGSFLWADMMTFELEHTYDVVLCLFSSIGYVKTLDSVREALQRFKDHLNPNGVIIVEPWFTPENYHSGRVFLHTAEDDEMKVVRMSHSEVVNGISRIQFMYLIGIQEGITHETETHELGLFTFEEMTGCFKACGLDVQYDTKGIFDRGLYIAKNVSRHTQQDFD